MWNFFNLTAGLASIIALAYLFYEIGRRTGPPSKMKETDGESFDRAAAKLLKHLDSSSTVDVDVVGYSVHALLDRHMRSLSEEGAGRRQEGPGTNAFPQFIWSSREVPDGVDVPRYSPP